VFLVNSMLVVKTFLINCHNYCDHFCPNEQPDGRIWCHFCDPIINLALGPSEHIVPFAAFTICPQVVRVFFELQVFYSIILDYKILKLRVYKSKAFICMNSLCLVK